ncbi:MAG: AMP-binding protein, partial [Methylococcales bacterium]
MLNNIGVVSKNSLSYVRAIFDAYVNKQTVVLLRSADDKSRIDQMGVETVIEPKADFCWFDAAYRFDNSDELAQISFTSGTEGDPKGVLLTHQMLSDATTRLNKVMELDASVCEYVGVPTNFSFGLGRFRAVSAVGGRAFLPEFGFNPVEIRDMLQAGEINSVSAVPTLWRVLLKNQSIFGVEALNLKWIEIGSQFMSGLEKSQLTEKLASFIADPVVNISVQSAEGNIVYVIGQVKRPGQFVMYQPLDVMQV